MKKELRVLVIEDVPTDLELIQHELRRSGLAFQSKRIETADQFLLELKQSPPDVILSDHGVPHFDGFSALAETRRRLPEVPFIFVTGQGNEAFAAEALRSGADGCVFKHQLGLLAPAIQRGLRTAKTRAQERRFQAATHRAERQLRAVTEAARDYAVFDLDPEGRVTFWHPSAERLLGWTAAEAGRRELASFFPRQERRAVRHLLKQARLQGTAEESSRHLVRKDGSEFPAAVRLSPAGTNPGLSEGWTCVLHELTRTKQLASELETRAEHAARQRTAQHEADYRELLEFASTVGQGLRTPLRHIDSFVELLQKTISSQLDPKSRAGLRTIIDSARNMESQLDELLAFVRVGQADLYRFRFSLAEVVREVQQDLRREIEGRQIEWKIGPLPEVVGDPTLLGLALHHLLANAVKFTRSRPLAQIQISSTQTDNEIIVAVTDNGIGFDNRHRAKLFGVFQRLHPGAEETGLGVGLANVRRIVQRHGGRTWAEGSVDRGATFYLALPRPPERPESESTTPSD